MHVLWSNDANADVIYTRSGSNEARMVELCPFIHGETSFAYSTRAEVPTLRLAASAEVNAYGYRDIHHCCHHEQRR